MNMRRAIGTLVLAASVSLAACDDITGSGGDATIIVLNNSTAAVWYLYIAQCDDDTWGNDELGDDVILPGGDRSFGVDVGCYDLRAEFGDESFADERGVIVDRGDEFTWELVDGN